MAVQLKFEVRALLWRDDDMWHGATLELEASSSGSSLQKAMSELVDAAHRVAAKQLAAGEFPGRPLADVPDLVAKWEALDTTGGARRPWNEVCEDASQGRCSSVATNIKLQPRAESATQDACRVPAPVQFILVPSDGWWVAQCLQFDIGGEGRTEEDAVREALRAIKSQCALDQALGRTPLEHLPAAPSEFWELFATGEDVGSLALSEPSPDKIDPVFRVAS